MFRSICIATFIFLLISIESTTFAQDPAKPDDPANIVILTGDDEYRSEESMPMIAKIMQRDFGCKVSVGFSVNQDGHVDPNEQESITETEALAEADLMVLFLRFRRPDDATFKRITDYLEAGKPVVAFRTSTHAFRFAQDSPHAEWGFQDDPTFQHSFKGGKQIRELLGQQWITHHGHFADGKDPLTAVSIRDKSEDHPILRGVKPFKAYSWLYHVEGGGDTVAGDPNFLLDGKSLRSKHQEKGNDDRYPTSNPIAWTKTHSWGKKPARVFTTTLGHPYDFKDPQMRRLAIQGMLWAMEKEELIPADGVSTDLVGDYQPNNSGFGEKFKTGLKPTDLFKAQK